MLSDVAMAYWECLLSPCKIEMRVPLGEGGTPISMGAIGGPLWICCGCNSPLQGAPGAEKPGTGLRRHSLSVSLLAGSTVVKEFEIPLLEASRTSQERT